MRKLACVCSGWHFPAYFYKQMERQAVMKGWEVDFFCIAHRLPEQAHDKELENLGDSRREQYDRTLYARIADMDDLANWHFKLYPNTMGDWGCSNQWLEDYDYKKYDAFLFTHDDNYILRNDFLLQAMEKKDWNIISNSCGAPKGWLRGSCEFFSREMMDKMGGRFDLSLTTLTREGKTDTPNDLGALDNWNASCIPLMRFIEKEGIKTDFLSDYYRVSKYCLEGERGWIHRTHGGNTASEEAGLDYYNL